MVIDLVLDIRWHTRGVAVDRLKDQTVTYDGRIGAPRYRQGHGEHQ